MPTSVSAAASTAAHGRSSNFDTMTPSEILLLFPKMDNEPHRGARMSLQASLHQIVPDPTEGQRRKADALLVDNMDLGFLRAVALVTPDALKEDEP